MLLSETILLGSPYSKSLLLHVFEVICIEPFHLLYNQWICCGNLQYKYNACYSHLSFSHVAWKSRQMEQFFTIFSMSAFMLIQYIDFGASSRVFSIPMLFMCGCFSALSCSTIGIILLLLLLQSNLWMTSMAAGLSVPQLFLKASHRVWVCAHNLALLFLFLLLSCMTIALGVMHTPVISTSLFMSWVVSW